MRRYHEESPSLDQKEGRKRGRNERGREGREREAGREKGRKRKEEKVE